ncbi:hypothetical protein GGS26DRAFT_550954 [Hypomontagnella submonticulosa]|nr:hypothetical protein GGS26DRAFT_550954 [Hypomontagnella submonticulosa]
MPPVDLLTDDHVADVLVKEAQDYSLQYSAMGLDAPKSTKRPANQPKPNTRFLNNIIRDTNSHNRALLAKESAESQAKLRILEDAEKEKRREEERRLRKVKPGPGDTRKRMLGDIAAILGESSKKRKTEKSERTEKAGTASRKASDLAGTGTGGRASRWERGAAGGDIDTKVDYGRRDRIMKHSGRSRHGHQREQETREARPSSSTSRRRKGYSPRRDSIRRSSSARRAEREPSESEDPSDSDPLEDIIGPAPAKNSAVRRRGRGANATTSGIDSRFAADYDPRNDVTPEPEQEDDWDHAVEAFRDRQKWKQKGADRLRSAGFTEEEIKKWEKGDQKDEADVQWTKAGGLREWDRGKVVNKDGSVSLAKGNK